MASKTKCYYVYYERNGERSHSTKWTTYNESERVYKDLSTQKDITSCYVFYQEYDTACIYVARKFHRPYFKLFGKTIVLPIKLLF